jgi:hypothetical protein
MSKIWFMLLSVSVLSACSPGADTQAAEKSIASFHADLNAGNFDKIYDGSGPDLKAVANKDKFTKILNAVHTKLGVFKDGKSVGWNDNVTTGGHFVTINYKADYNKGSADENFVFRVEETGSSLVGYHVNSEALLLN